MVSKINVSSLQVMKTLQLLLQGNFTMRELVEKLNENEQEAIFNNNVVSKYINTCRFCGIEIPKIQNKYFVTSVPFGLELNVGDITLLENLQNIIKTEMASRYHKLYDSFIEKLNRYSNKKIARVEKSSYKLSAELFENAILERRKIRLMLKNKTLIDCIPLNVTENKGKIFFNVYYKNKEKAFDSDRVSGIEVLPQQFIRNFIDPSVTFILKGDLAKRYELKENEQYTETDRVGCVAVTNRGECKEILLARLLRYDDKCEIISPQSYREEMRQILDDTLKNYGEM